MISKDSFLFDCLGDIDEAVCSLGLAKLLLSKEERHLLTRIQKNLMEISSFIVGYQKKVKKSSLKWLEKKIAVLERKIELPNKFVLPGKSELEGRLQFSRAIIRRLERKIVALSKKRSINEEILTYLNKLSWFLFILAIGVRRIKV